ncbi:uncharacterized protein LOC105694815 [Orussus abietinus]|uniref:uncharacterized protein LOC105694815 n=1 Tax=Orussus abietinus TaxID=222816 RepID=UPI000625FDC7|nr:uncharacterized protein LOC105694815 [Orussus abietinus]
MTEIMAQKDAMTDQSQDTSNIDLKEKKDRLQKQIAELKALIFQIELNLNITKFGNIKNVKRLSESISTSRKAIQTIPNVEIELQNDLYKFAGMQCVKFTKEEFVFKFFSVCETRNVEVYTIQFFNKDGVGTLGKWALPMPIDMDRILEETPINVLSQVTLFLRNCKHYINCYTSRMEQYFELKRYLNGTNNCTVDSSFGYSHINIQLFGFHRLETNTFLNIEIYLCYDLAEARPEKVHVDPIGKKKFTPKEKNELMLLIKYFKYMNLQSAFEKFTDGTTASFVWTKETVESPMEINISSSSESESILKEAVLVRKQTAEKKKRKQDLMKKWKQGQSVRSSKILEWEKIEELKRAEENLLKHRSYRKEKIQKQRRSKRPLSEESEQDLRKRSLRETRGVKKIKEIRISSDDSEEFKKDAPIPARHKETNSSVKHKFKRIISKDSEEDNSLKNGLCEDENQGRNDSQAILLEESNGEDVSVQILPSEEKDQGNEQAPWYATKNEKSTTKPIVISAPNAKGKNTSLTSRPGPRSSKSFIQEETVIPKSTEPKLKQTTLPFKSLQGIKYDFTKDIPLIKKYFKKKENVGEKNTSNLITTSTPLHGSSKKVIDSPTKVDDLTISDIQST